MALYVVLATAAIYTHYFAFFLLLALSLAFFIDQLLVLPRRARRAEDGSEPLSYLDGVGRGPVLGFVAANVVVLVLYLPWMSTLITRLTIDTSYWEGALKLGEALRHIGISFIGGETILEEQAVRLLAPYAVATALLIPPLVWRNSGQIRTALYALLWLTVPIAGVLLLASLVPKFNARYVMIALPGLILLWAAGLAELSAFSDWNLLRGFSTHGAGFAFPICHHGDARAVRRLRIRRPQLVHRPCLHQSGVAAACGLRARAELERQGDEDGSDTQVVLVSGHAWPVWNYYAPDLAAVAPAGPGDSRRERRARLHEQRDPPARRTDGQVQRVAGRMAGRDRRSDGHRALAAQPRRARGRDRNRNSGNCNSATTPTWTPTPYS